MRVLSVAATAIESGSTAGHDCVLAPAFPAATTTGMRCPTAYTMAASTAGIGPVDPSERLMTVAPWFAASTTPAATSAAEPEAWLISWPLASYTGAMTRTGRIDTSGATPAIPSPLPATRR